MQKLNQDEKVFFLQAGTILNEINILIKLLVISQAESENDVVSKAQHSQTIFFLSLLSGKLWECWQFLNKAYFNTKLSKKYDSELSDEGLESLKKLKAYFNKNNLINDIRDELSFHYDIQKVKNQIPWIFLDQLPEIYLAENQGNSLFYISDIIQLKRLLEYTGKKDAKIAKEALFTEVLTIADRFIKFIYHILLVMIGNQNEIELEKIDIGEAPSIGNVSLPYFVEK